MSKDPHDDQPIEGSQPKEGEPSSTSALEKKEEAKIEAILDKLPPEQAQHTLRELFFGIIERGGTSPAKIDPEAFKIAAATVEKDNDNKFRYLRQKQSDAAEESKREHDFAVVQHKDRFGILRPVVFIIVFVFAICLFVGIYLAATGHETLGSWRWCKSLNLN
jgi:hypothetical protein